MLNQIFILVLLVLLSLSIFIIVKKLQQIKKLRTYHQNEVNSLKSKINDYVRSNDKLVMKIVSLEKDILKYTSIIKKLKRQLI